MRMILAPAILMWAVIGASNAAGQTKSISGEWIAADGKATVRFGPCVGSQANLCGRLVDLPPALRKVPDFKNADPALRRRPLLGILLFMELHPDGPNHWGGGKLYYPRDGKTYDAKMALDRNDVLTISGCVFGLCKGQTWTRVNH